MTIQRIVRCKNPDCPHERLLFFSDWIRENLPDSTTGYNVSDVDFILSDEYKKRFMIIELKNKGKHPTNKQKEILRFIHKCVLIGLKHEFTSLKYDGFNLIKFDGYNFSDGDVYFNENKISEHELIRKLSFLD